MKLLRRPALGETNEVLVGRAGRRLATLAPLVLGLIFAQKAEADYFLSTGRMNISRGYSSATLLNNGKVLVTGGIFGTILSSAELYDGARGTWTVTGAMTNARVEHTATILPSGKVLVAGGDSVGNRAELYDPASGTWSATGTMTTNRSDHTAILLANGLVLVAGGFSGGRPGSLLSSAELYDPATGTWPPTGGMSIGRRQHTATLLPNGQVLVAAGATNIPSAGSAGAELYDPATGVWTNTGALNFARNWHTATLCPAVSCSWLAASTAASP